MTRRVKRPMESTSSFPTETCAVCKHCHCEDDAYLCWVDKPIIIDADEDGAPVFMRGFPVDPNWPMCMHFTPRMHA